MPDPTTTEGPALAREIAILPGEVLAVIRSGFALAAALPDRALQQAIEVVVRQMERAGGSVDTDAMVAVTGLNRREASRLNAALSTAVGLLTEGNASIQEFVAAGEGKIFDQSQAAMAEGIATQIVGRRVELQRSMARENLTNRVLPSLTSFDVAIDVRFEFNGDVVDDRVAVAVVHIGTDTRFQRIWLQLGRHDVETIVEKLTNALKQMAVAEDMTSRAAKGTIA